MTNERVERLSPIRYNQTGLRGRTARVTSENLLFDFPPTPDLTHVIILDDEPSVTMDIRVADLRDPTKHYVTDVGDIQLIE